MVITRTRIKTKVQRSVSSKDTVKTNGRIDEETDATRDCCKILPFAVMPSVARVRQRQRSYLFVRGIGPDLS